MYERTPLYALGMYILSHFFEQWSAALANDWSFIQVGSFFPISHLFKPLTWSVFDVKSESAALGDEITGKVKHKVTRIVN